MPNYGSVGAGAGGGAGGTIKTFDYNPKPSTNYLGDAINWFGQAYNPYEPGAVAQDWREVNTSRAASEQARDEQSRLAEALWRRQQGLSPSVAEAQLNQATQANMAGAASMAASARGGALGQAAAQQQAMAQRASMQQQAAGQGATLRAQEQAQAEQAIGDLTQAQRAQDLQRQQIEAQMQLGVGSQQVQQQGIAAGSYDNAMDRRTNLFSMGAGAVAGALGIGALSDERAKTDIEPMPERDLESFLEAAKAYWYRYKGEDGPRRGGVMAQDLADSEMGRALVQRGDDGMLRIDQGGGLGAALASLGSLHDRVQRLEGKGK